MNNDIIQTVCKEIINSLSARYPGTDFRSAKDAIEYYMSRQMKSDNYISAGRISNGIGRTDLTQKAFDDRILVIKDKDGKDIEIDLQLEIYLAIKDRMLRAIDKAEKSFVGMQIHYDQSRDKAPYTTSKNYLDFSNLQTCGHLLGLPNLNVLKNIFKTYAGEYRLKTGRGPSVNFPNRSTASLTDLKRNIKDFLENVSPNVHNIRDFKQAVHKIVNYTMAFYNKNANNLNLKDSQELSDLMRLLSNHIKNMEKLFNNDMELQFNYLKSDSFTLDLLKLFDRDDLFIINNKKLEPFNAEDYKDDYPKLLSVLHLIVDKDRTPVFTFLGNRSLNRNIIKAVSKHNPIANINKADAINFGDVAIDYVYDYIRGNKNLLPIIESSCKAVRYASYNKIDDIIYAIDMVMDCDRDKLDEKITGILTSLKAFLLNRKSNKEITSEYNPEKYYLQADFKKDLLSVVVSQLGPNFDIENINFKEFYYQNKGLFPYEISPLPEILKPNKKINDFPFSNEFQRLLAVDDKTNFEQLYITISNQMIAYYEQISDNLNIEDYMLYRDMKEKMSARCHEFGYKNVFQEEKIDNINNLFDFSLTLETNTNKLDLARIDIDTKTHTRRFFDRIFDGTNDPILPSEGFDPLLLFRFLCTQKDGMEVFLQNQDSISFNFAKMVSKGPLFESLCDISFSNVSFKINDKQQILARYGVKLVLNKRDRAYQITSLIEESSRERNAKVVHFKDLKAIATMKSLGIKGVYESKDNLLTIPSDFDLAQKVA